MDIKHLLIIVTNVEMQCRTYQELSNTDSFPLLGKSNLGKRESVTTGP